MHTNASTLMNSQLRMNRLEKSNQLFPEELSQNYLKSENRMSIKYSCYVMNPLRMREIFCPIYQYNSCAKQNFLQQSGVSQFIEICRLCNSDQMTSRFIIPCQCTDQKRFVHEECLKMQVLKTSRIEELYKNNVFCPECKSNYNMKIKMRSIISCAHLARKSFNWKLAYFSFWILILVLSLVGGLLFYSFGFYSRSVDIGVVVMFVFDFLLIVFASKQLIDSMTIDYIILWQFVSLGDEVQPIKSQSPLKSAKNNRNLFNSSNLNNQIENNRDLFKSSNLTIKAQEQAIRQQESLFLDQSNLGQSQLIFPIQNQDIQSPTKKSSRIPYRIHLQQISENEI